MRTFHPSLPQRFASIAAGNARSARRLAAQEAEAKAAREAEKRAASIAALLADSAARRAEVGK